MALTFDEGIEIFDKLKKLVYALDERTHERMRLEIVNGNDFVFRIKFFYDLKTTENCNTMLTIANDERQISIWYNYLNDFDDLAGYFLSRQVPSLSDLWSTKRIDVSFDADIDIDTIVECTNAVLDVYETGMKIREKAKKQLEINFEKFKELKVKEDLYGT